MSALRSFSLTCALLVALGLAPAAFADDIDIFAGTSSGIGGAPNVMILIDNSPNWARNSQKWPDNGGNQGSAELTAITQVLTYLTQKNQDINVGLAMLTPNSGGIGSGGGYVRFGARNMNVSANNTALKNLLNNISACVNGCGSADEALNGMAHKDETEAFFELYLYFSGLAPYAGGYPTNTWDDVSGNLGGGSSGSGGLTAYAQGLSSGWAIANGIYQSPITTNNPCAANYIIYIANNANGTSGAGPWENYYKPIIPALTALPAAPAGGGDTWTDEWTRYLYQSGAQVPAGNNNGSITTYVLDAFYAQDNAQYSASLQAAARQGGGSYFQVGTQAAIYTALVTIFEQIQAVNSTFASASLPVNTSNRAQSENQVYVPMFRPDAKLQPRWFGNLKQYQLINVGGAVELGDAESPTPQPVVNPLTGFPTACALSFWTSDSTDTVHFPNGYWNFGNTVNAAGYTNTTMEVTYAKGTCPTDPYSVWADDPDGPVVEKGGVAEVIRKGNNPGSPATWSPANRTVLTIGATATSGNPVAFSQSSTGLSDANLVKWVLGQDVQDENGNSNTTETRPSVHGDEIHSRPVPIDYGSGVTRVFYGSNDGTLRAIDGSSGKELWAFVAPEFYTPTPAVYPGATPTGLERLMWSGMTATSGTTQVQISPTVLFPNTPAGLTPTPTKKDYYFDGSIGLYEGAINAHGAPSAVWIYPAMRRGGRMLYALDVTNSTSPVLLWKFGCPHLADDNSCLPSGAANVSSIGQTWSTPAATTSVLGYSSPVVIVGGGYDSCEDSNVANPSTTTNPSTGKPYCPSPQKGSGVYVFDAQSGSELAFFTATGMGSAAADIALISVATPGVVDHAYVADTRGNIYRIDFSATRSAWAMNLVAYTNGQGRKFLFPPALLAAPGNQVYLALGSGDREHPLQSEYPYSTPILNRFYVFKDNLSSTTDSFSLDDTSKMLDLTYDSLDPGTGNIATGTNCNTTGVLPSSSQNGWFIDLNANGTDEQTVTSAIIVAGMVAFSTNRPVPQTAGSCSTPLGDAYGYWLNLFNASGGIGASGAACGGARNSGITGGGLPPSPVVAVVPVGGQVVTAVGGAAQLSGGPSSGTGWQNVQPSIVPTRKSVFWKSSGQN